MRLDACMGHDASLGQRVTHSPWGRSTVLPGFGVVAGDLLWRCVGCSLKPAPSARREGLVTDQATIHCDLTVYASQQVSRSTLH
jgi:hypothetical protein